MKKINQILGTAILCVFLFLLIKYSSPGACREWWDSFNKETPCDMMQKQIELEKAEKRRLEAIRINKNFGITH